MRRNRLIEHLQRERGQSLEEAIRIAQVLLDRIIFVAFCEDRGLLPEKCIENAYNKLPPFSKVTNPRWQNFLGLFKGIDKGHRDLGLDHGYNGGLFKHDLWQLMISNSTTVGRSSSATSATTISGATK